MRLAKKIWFGIAALIVLPLAAILLINAFDEKLDPKLETYGMPRAPKVADAENGYYALIGLSAPDGADTVAYAKAWVAEARAAAKENRLENRGNDGDKRAKRPALCDVRAVSCFAIVRADPDGIKALIEAYREDLERYERLIAHTHYEEVLDYPLRVVTSFPGFGAASAAQRAYLLRAMLAAEAGRVEEAVAAIERDIAFQRVMLAGARTLIGKMVAASNYTRDLELVSDLIQTHGAGLTPALSRLRAMLGRIDPAALQLAEAAEIEFAFIRAGIRDPLGAMYAAHGGHGLLESIAVKFLHKPNASIHRAHQDFMQAWKEVGVPAGELAASAGKKIDAPKMTFWDYVDNPLGNHLRSIGNPDESVGRYALRLHDLDGLNRLIGLRVEILAAGVSADTAGEYAAKSDARFHDPYMQKPMAWNSANNQLSFKAHGRGAAHRSFNAATGTVFVRL